MGWSKEVAEALAVLKRAYGSFVFLGRAQDSAGVLIHAHAPSRALVEDIERWLKAYKTTPPPGKVTVKYGQRPHDGRDVPRNAEGYEVQALPCEVADCPVKRHIVGEFEPGMRVKTLVPRKVEYEKAVTILPGATGKIISWSQYGQPLYYRIEFDDIRDYTYSEFGHPVRENYFPCEIALVEE